MKPQCTPEQKQHMINLIEEMRNIVADLPNTLKKPMPERKKIAVRMQDIKAEMQKFRRDYPDA